MCLYCLRGKAEFLRWRYIVHISTHFGNFNIYIHLCGAILLISYLGNNWKISSTTLFVKIKMEISKGTFLFDGQQKKQNFPNKTKMCAIICITLFVLCIKLLDMSGCHFTRCPKLYFCLRFIQTHIEYQTLTADVLKSFIFITLVERNTF